MSDTDNDRDDDDIEQERERTIDQYAGPPVTEFDIWQMSQDEIPVTEEYILKYNLQPASGEILRIMRRQLGLDKDGEQDKEG